MGALVRAKISAGSTGCHTGVRRLCRRDNEDFDDADDPFPHDRDRDP
jgi:hypothetical protein